MIRSQALVAACVAVVASGCGSQSETTAPFASGELDAGVEADSSLQPDAVTNDAAEDVAPEAMTDAAGQDANDSADAFDDAAGEAATDATDDAETNLDSGTDAPAGPVALRYLAVNTGNASIQYGCDEYKLCREQDVRHLREYIAAWQPDVVMLSELARGNQLLGTGVHGPVLPPGYQGVCGESRDRTTGELAAPDAPNASHEHECIGWKSSRLSLIAGSTQSAYGRNDDYGKKHCSYDFTGFRARLLLDGQYEITAVAVHPNSQVADCRLDEIARYWSELADGERTIIGGDWNTEDRDELQVPSGFRVNFSAGQHWDLAKHDDEWSAVYALGLYGRHLDHAFSNFGQPCTNCGALYGTVDLALGSALGGYDGHPRADAGEGMDHRQMLVDLVFEP